MSTVSLHEMTLEELWQLFPISLSPHNPEWRVWAHNEMDILSSLLAPFNPVLNHIGSTAIPDILAKPIVDILVEVPMSTELRHVKNVMETSGYICMAESEVRISFNKGYTRAGYADKVFHVHVHLSGDHDEIIFRDYLITHPPMAREYERLKSSLLPRYRNDRDAYTGAKTSFVKKILDLSRIQDTPKHDV